MTRNEFTLLYTIQKYGLMSYRSLKEMTDLSLGYISQTVKQFSEEHLISGSGITEAGLELLEPYRIKNAVIMAAGMSSRFVPISIEKPKGILTVKGEVLIERQIRQLQEAGIQDIILVLGYKKEAFFYLEDKFDHIKIIINPKYDIRNNVFTVYLAQHYIDNTYICSSDNYFTDNPFEKYAYQSFYSAIEVDHRMNEWYMIPDSKMNISKIIKNAESGYIMMGHVYWDRSFSREMIRLINNDQETGFYQSELWEQILADYVKKLPPMEIRVYPDHMIHEFDSLDELRVFDSRYIKHTNSKIIKDIISVLHCREEDIQHFKTLKNGLTNVSVYFEVNSRKYVYRYTENNEEIKVNRIHEKRALELSRSIGINPTYIYMNESEGWLISSYIDNARIPEYQNKDDVRRVAEALRMLHQQKISVSWTFLPWEEIRNMELLLRSDNAGISDREFDEIKSSVERVYNECSNDQTEMCFCHCDPVIYNWLLTDHDSFLIDWEYAGKADPGCDIGSFILHSSWEPEEAKDFIREYCGKDATEKQLFHYLAYTAVIAFYWYIWALYREANGVVMGEGLYLWRATAKKYARYLIQSYGL